LVAISVEVVRIPFNCAGFDDRVVVFVVVIPAKPKYDIPRVKWEFLHRKLLAHYFNNVDCVADYLLPIRCAPIQKAKLLPQPVSQNSQRQMVDARPIAMAGRAQNLSLSWTIGALVAVIGRR
jgi:hypothetical protein